MTDDELSRRLYRARGVAETMVSDKDTALSMGSGDLPLLGTPRVVAWIEAAALSAIAGRLDDHLTTVGGQIDIHHSAPTRVGAEVRTEASVAEVNGRRIVFDVSVMSGGREIARGRHVRAIVDRAGFLARANPPATAPQ